MAKPSYTLYIRDNLWHIPQLNGSQITMHNITWNETKCGVFVRLDMRLGSQPICEACHRLAERDWGIQIASKTAKPGFRAPVADLTYQAVSKRHEPEPEPQPIRERVMRVQP